MSEQPPTNPQTEKGPNDSTTSPATSPPQAGSRPSGPSLPTPPVGNGLLITVMSDGNFPILTVALAMVLARYKDTNPYVCPVVYKLAFGHPTVEDDKITATPLLRTIQKGQITELQKDEKENYSFTDPVPAGKGYERAIVAKNDCPLLEQISINVNDGTGFQPVQIWRSVGSTYKLATNFAPILRIYGWIDPTINVSPGQILQENGPGDLLWEADPSTLRVVTMLQLTFDLTTQKLALKPSP
ncbi:SubName: Full=Uncharacterized protein {ECO:0000313/EMBL:CCA75994.1} [Serendipita indica DSM 11827]|nr:SubName: Full=Uncharacterized protein {ECO:0000313/EMBL:CCA75994.1} [Serendipita indica DSM 11827]